MSWTKISNPTELSESQSGVYVMYSEDSKVIYIGHSIDLKRRISHHPKRSFFSYLKFKKLDNTDNRIELETRLIKKLRPHLNKSHNPKMPQNDLGKIRVSIPCDIIKALDIYQATTDTTKSEALCQLLQEPLKKELQYLRENQK